jgi:hypothetical protein
MMIWWTPKLTFNQRMLRLGARNLCSGQARAVKRLAEALGVTLFGNTGW